MTTHRRRTPAVIDWAALQLLVKRLPDEGHSTSGRAGSGGDDVAIAVRQLCAFIAEKHPGRTIELRVPPFGAVQLALGRGSVHTRGNPPNVVETDPGTFLRLCTGALDWHQARAAHLVVASGTHSDLSGLFPLQGVPDVRLPRSATATTTSPGTARADPARTARA